MQPLIDIRRIVKSYRTIRAVDNVSLSIAPGVCLGLLGPNGAGKTTLIEIVEASSSHSRRPPCR